ncbi:cobalamin-dependent protein [Nocardioides sp. LHD-245]|uniref:cobalamin-dependent protein n=1 Tax=Nocardioides sp. LHD-245 TaxID=3051387 RepID=UPI0027E078B9|nr:cobalamin-dependent protein [Nocardioides sp. LHD-245]
MSAHVPRVLMAKPGLDGHDRGIIVVARALRDAGAEVIYTGLRADAEAIARTATIEDVDVVGLSMSGGGHVGLTRDVIAALRAATGRDDLGGISVIVGGNLPDRDEETMIELGVARVFGQSEPLQAIVDFVASFADVPSPASRPLLTLDQLWPGRVIGPQLLTIDEATLSSYAAIAGTEHSGDVPEGLLGMLARRAYLAEHDMPPGGVMLGQDLAFFAPVPRDAELELVAEIEEVGERKGRPYVRIRSVVRHDGAELAAMTTHAGWPGKVSA